MEAMLSKNFTVNPRASSESSAAESQITVVRPSTSGTVPACLPGLNQNPLCVEWKCLSLGNDFSRVDKSQHGDLQLGEQPFGYAEPCLH